MNGLEDAIRIGEKWFRASQARNLGLYKIPNERESSSSLILRPEVGVADRTINQWGRDLL